MHAAVRIGTRGSRLALWQARTVAGRLEARGIAAELVVIRTAGDRLQEAPLSEAGGKRLFVKEIEDALLRGEIDAAVHSAKDMPAVLPEGLSVAATLPRDDPRDALVLRAGEPAGSVAAVLTRLEGTPRVGTSSIRRTAQLRALFRTARFEPVRGNVDTRLRKLDQREYDVLVLAAAGLRRLGLEDRISARLTAEDCVPAPGQGIVAIETRADDGGARDALARIHDSSAGLALDAERALVAALGGGCQLPLGALAVPEPDGLRLHAVVCSPDGRRVVRAVGTSAAADAAALGARVARDLAARGAVAILDEVRQAHGPLEGSY